MSSVRERWARAPAVRCVSKCSEVACPAAGEGAPARLAPQRAAPFAPVGALGPRRFRTFRLIRPLYSHRAGDPGCRERGTVIYYRGIVPHYNTAHSQSPVRSRRAVTSPPVCAVRIAADNVPHRHRRSQRLHRGYLHDAPQLNPVNPPPPRPPGSSSSSSLHAQARYSRVVYRYRRMLCERGVGRAGAVCGLWGESSKHLHLGKHRNGNSAILSYSTRNSYGVS